MHVFKLQILSISQKKLQFKQFIRQASDFNLSSLQPFNQCFHNKKDSLEEHCSIVHISICLQVKLIVYFNKELTQQRTYLFLFVLFPMYSALIPVSYTHLTLPTICSVQISVVAVSLKKKKEEYSHYEDRTHRPSS
eukprot:TRINITY_DN33613_c0_g1_i1.p1 TRINITY_DN33613_c0_g1~~TRINITY_DN33613_c0_g1_i1.p1  ORF type:complete len:136 (-),score=14.47 TRINITY_DN33613_c0_g1_i1:49-456(-)